MPAPETSQNAERRHLVTAYSRHQNTTNCRNFYRSINALLEQGFVVHCISAGDLKLSGENLILQKTKLPVHVRSGFLFWLLFYFSAALEMFRVLRSTKVFSFFFTRSHYSFLAWPLSLVFRVPIILQLTSVPREERQATIGFPPKRWVLNLLDSLGIAAAKLIVVPSEYLRGQLSPAKSPKIHVLSRCVSAPPAVTKNGADTIDAESWRAWISKFTSRRRELAETYGLSEKGIFLVCSIEFATQRNMEVLIRAVSAAENDRLALFVLGENSNKSYMHTMVVSLGLYDQVVFVDASVDLRSMLSSCDLLVQTSTRSGNGEVLREALGCGLPVLAAESAEAEELLGMKELMFKPQNVQSLTERYITLLNTKADLERLRKMSRERALTLMSDWGKDLAEMI